VVRQQLREAQAQLQRIQRARREQIAEAQATLERIREVRPVDVELARAEVLRAQAAVTRAQAELDLAIVRAPQDGQVLKIHTRAGELVGDRGVISLGQTQEMVAVAEVYEVDLSRVRLGQRATVRSKNNAFAEVLRGEVMEVGLEISKQDVLDTDPAARFDARVAEVKILLDRDSSQKVAALTNLTVEVEIESVGGTR
jgi:HlyD family secretion protein